MADQPQALGHFRILDLTQTNGQYATRLLADLGADVIKVEPPEGAAARGAWPFAGEVEGIERSLAFFHFNTNKRGITLDLTTPQGRETFLRLVHTADAVVQDFSPGRMEELGLGYQVLQAANPGIVLTSITPFGQTGPRAHWKGSDLIIQAISEWMAEASEFSLPPCACPADPTLHIGGAHAAVGILMALWARRKDGEGQHVDASLYQAMVGGVSSVPIARYSIATEIAGGSGAGAKTAGVNCYRCSDGWVAMNIHFGHLWKRLVEWIDSPLLNDPYWLTSAARNDNVELAEEVIRGFAEAMTVAEFLHGARERGLPVARLNNFAEALQDPQVEARHWIQEVDHPVLGRVRVPGVSWILSETPARIHHGAPVLGEHTEEVLAELTEQAVSRDAAPGSSNGAGALPLQGIRIVDFTRAWAGPLATRFLADYGAEVIKVESSLFDTQRDGRAAIYTEFNRNKQSITVDLHNPEGQELIKRLVAHSDVVIENFRPGTLERFGLGYEVLKEANPKIILVSMPGYGSTGPARDYASHGANLMANAGVFYVWGHPDSPMESRGRSAYPDFLSGAQGALVVLAALHWRETTGLGQSIEVAQSESLSAALGVGLLDSLVNGRNWEPSGNRRSFAAPHDVYPCHGIEAYCAITCAEDKEWVAMCEVMDRPELAQDERFTTLAKRLANNDELDQVISEWTRDLTPLQVMHRLQKAGVPAGAVHTGENIYYDIHLRDRGFMVEVDDPESGIMEVSGLTLHLSRTPGRSQMNGRPVFGGGNDYVFHELLGLSQQEREALEASKAIA
jgi:crotonobetainyl-CoA:carnitine CoA-transferase CaiB-like acyl-CoA transferase